MCWGYPARLGASPPTAALLHACCCCRCTHATPCLSTSCADIHARLVLHLLAAPLIHPTHSLDTRARAYGDNLAENPRYAEKGKHYYDACGPTYKVAKVRERGATSTRALLGGALGAAGGRSCKGQLSGAGMRLALQPSCEKQCLCHCEMLHCNNPTHS